MCFVRLKYDVKSHLFNNREEVCDNIQNHTEKQVEVQKYVSTLKSYNQVLQAIPPCVLVLFTGPWSDKYGRKPLLISALFGYFLSNAIFFFNTYFFFELKAEFLLFEAIQGKWYS